MTILRYKQLKTRVARAQEELDKADLSPLKKRVLQRKLDKAKRAVKRRGRYENNQRSD